MSLLVLYHVGHLSQDISLTIQIISWSLYFFFVVFSSSITDRPGKISKSASQEHF